MATTITIKGDSKSAEQALGKLIVEMEKGSKSAKGYSTSLNQVDTSLKNTASSATKAAAAVGNVGTASAAMAGGTGKAARAVVGLGSAFGVLGASVATVVSSMGPWALALSAVAVAVTGAIAGYQFLTKETKELGASHVKAASGVSALNKALAESNALDKDRRAQGFAEAGEFEKRLAVIKRGRENEIFAAKEIAKFRGDSATAEKRLKVLQVDRLRLLQEGAKLNDNSLRSRARRKVIEEALLDLTAKETALKQQSLAMDTQAAAILAGTVKESAARNAAHVKFLDRQAAAEKAKLQTLKDQAAARVASLASLKEEQSIAAGGDEVVTGDAGGGGGGSFLGGIFGGVGKALGGARQGIGQAGVNLNPRAPRGGGGASAAGAGGLLGGQSKRQVNKRARSNRVAAGGKASGDLSGSEIAKAQQELANAEISRAEGRGKIDADTAAAMRLQLESITEVATTQANHDKDIKTLMAAYTALSGNVRERRQRGGR